MKPLFANPFASLVTRTGQAIGKAAERKMLNATGELGFVKKYRQNPDGSTTMLKTRGGMPRFYTSGGIAGNLFTINESAVYEGSGNADHFLLKIDNDTDLSPFTFKLWIVPKIAGTFTISGFSESAFSLSGDTVTVGGDYHFLWYPFTVSVSYSDVSGADVGKVAYELRTGRRRGKNSDVGIATVTLY